jgi:hypothetical protein
MSDQQKLFTEHAIGVRVLGTASRELEQHALRVLFTDEGGRPINMLNRLVAQSGRGEAVPLIVGEPPDATRIDLLKYFRPHGEQERV